MLSGVFTLESMLLHTLGFVLALSPVAGFAIAGVLLQRVLVMEIHAWYVALGWLARR